MSRRGKLRLLGQGLLWSGPFLAGTVHLGWHRAAMLGLVLTLAFLLGEGFDALAGRLGETGTLPLAFLLAFGLTATLYSLGAGLLLLVIAQLAGALPSVPATWPAGLSIAGLVLLVLLPPEATEEDDLLVRALRWLHLRGGGDG